MGQIHSGELSTDEKLAYRSSTTTGNFQPHMSSNSFFPPTDATGILRVEVVASSLGYANSATQTLDYPLLKLDPVISPATVTGQGPTITVPNWSPDSIGSITLTYTLDGTQPGGGGTNYTVTIPPDSGEFIHTLDLGNAADEFNDTKTLKTQAVSDAYLNSNVGSYTTPILAAPTVNITNSAGILNITMSAVQPANESRAPTIRYTFSSLSGDNSLANPTENDYLYSSPINLQATGATFKAQSYLIGYQSSSITMETYP